MNWRPYSAEWIWEPRDLWIGLYRTGREWVPISNTQRISRWRWYVCLMPCLALRITWIEK